MAVILTLALTSAALLGISSAGALLSPRVAVGDKVELYVWGNNIPGLHIFYANGEYLVKAFAPLPSRREVLANCRRK
jgi:hypothetical protein